MNEELTNTVTVQRVYDEEGNLISLTLHTEVTDSEGNEVSV